jgi:hypothetical protein
MTVITRAMSAEQKNATLAQVLEWVRGLEAAWGPITKIGNDGEKTGASFDWNNPDNPKPTVPAEMCQTATGNAPDGRKKLCDGYPYISGQPVRVVVYR